MIKKALSLGRGTMIPFVPILWHVRFTAKNALDTYLPFHSNAQRPRLRLHAPGCTWLA